MRKPCGSGVPAILVAIAALQVLVSTYSSWIVKKPGGSMLPGFLGHFLERATEPTHPMYGGIKSTHALSHNGEDRHAPPSKRRTAGKWDT
jgi:hypothetical protein